MSRQSQPRKRNIDDPNRPKYMRQEGEPCRHGSTVLKPTPKNQRNKANKHEPYKTAAQEGIFTKSPR
jgi:hypothetical protein